MFKRIAGVVPEWNAGKFLKAGMAGRTTGNIRLGVFQGFPRKKTLNKLHQ